MGTILGCLKCSHNALWLRKNCSVLIELSNQESRYRTAANIPLDMMGAHILSGLSCPTLLNERIGGTDYDLSW